MSDSVCKSTTDEEGKQTAEGDATTARETPAGHIINEQE
jgi:hypothetical protein